MVQSSPFNQGPNGQGLNSLPGSSAPSSSYQIPMSAMEPPRDSVAFGLRAPKVEPSWWQKLFGLADKSGARDAAKNSNGVPLWAWLFGGAAIIATAGHFGGLWKKIGKAWKEAGGNAAGKAGTAAGSAAVKPTEDIIASFRTRLAKNSPEADAKAALNELESKVHANHQDLRKEFLELARQHDKTTVVQLATEKAHLLTDAGTRHTFLKEVANHNTDIGVLKTVANKTAGLNSEQAKELFTILLAKTDIDPALVKTIVEKCDPALLTDQAHLIEIVTKAIEHAKANEAVYQTAAEKAGNITDITARGAFSDKIIAKTSKTEALGPLAGQTDGMSSAQAQAHLKKFLTKSGIDPALVKTIVEKCDPALLTDQAHLIDVLTEAVKHTTANDAVWQAAAEKAGKITDITARGNFSSEIIARTTKTEALGPLAGQTDGMDSAQAQAHLKKFLDKTGIDSALVKTIVEKCDPALLTDQAHFIDILTGAVEHTAANETVYQATAEKTGKITDIAARGAFSDKIIAKTSKTEVLGPLAGQTDGMNSAQAQEHFKKFLTRSGIDSALVKTIVEKCDPALLTDQAHLVDVLTGAVEHTAANEAVYQTAAEKTGKITDIAARGAFSDKIIAKTSKTEALGPLAGQTDGMNSAQAQAHLKKFLTRSGIDPALVKTVVEKCDPALLTDQAHLVDVLTGAVEHTAANEAVYQAVANNATSIKSLEMKHLPPFAETFAKSKATKEQMQQLFQNVHDGNAVKLEALLERLADSTAKESRKAAIENVALLPNTTSRYLVLKKAVNPATTNDELVEAALNQFEHVTDQKQLQDLLENVLPSAKKTNTFPTNLYGSVGSSPYEQIDTFKSGFSKIGLIADPGIQNHLFALNLRDSIKNGNETVVTAIRDRMQSLTPEEVGLPASDTARLDEMKTKAMKSAKELAANLGLVDIAKKLPSEAASNVSGGGIDALETLAGQQKAKVTPLKASFSEAHFQPKLAQDTDTARTEYINTMFAYFQAGWEPSEAWVKTAIHSDNKAQKEAISTLIEFNKLKPGLLGKHVHLIDPALIADETTRQSLILQGLGGSKAEEVVGKIADFIPEANRKAFFQQALAAGYTDRITNGTIDSITSIINDGDIKKTLYTKASFHPSDTVAQYAKTRLPSA